jgi:hypothetical protein
MLYWPGGGPLLVLAGGNFGDLASIIEVFLLSEGAFSDTNGLYFPLLEGTMLLGLC